MSTCVQSHSSVCACLFLRCIVATCERARKKEMLVGLKHELARNASRGCGNCMGAGALQCAAGNACSTCRRRTCHKLLLAIEAPCRHREHDQPARMSAACANQSQSQPHCAKRAQRFGCHVHGNASSSLGPAGNGMSPRRTLLFRAIAAVASRKQHLPKRAHAPPCEQQQRGSYTYGWVG